MELTIRNGTMADVESFIGLMTEVHAEMEQKEWFCMDPPEVIRKAMEAGNMELWVAMDGQRLAAALSILHPGLEPENYGYDLDFDRDQLMKVVNMDTAVVDSGYRGRGLQRQLLERAESELRGRGETFLLCTIHPANSFSLNNALKAGYEIRKTQPKYGSIRHILCKKIF